MGEAPLSAVDLRRHACIGDPQGQSLTFSGGVRLHEVLPRAGIFEFGSEHGKLRQVLVDESQFGGKVVLVNVQSEPSSGVS